MTNKIIFDYQISLPTSDTKNMIPDVCIKGLEIKKNFINGGTPQKEDESAREFLTMPIKSLKNYFTKNNIEYLIYQEEHLKNRESKFIKILSPNFSLLFDINEDPKFDRVLLNKGAFDIIRNMDSETMRTIIDLFKKVKINNEYYHKQKIKLVFIE